jgi:anti-sigma B factor antagonist
MNMDILESADGTRCVRLHGRLDAPGADAIDLRFTAAVAAPGHHAIVDLSDVTFIASMGIRLLIGTARALHTKGARMILFGAQGMVLDVLQDASIDQIIPMVASEQLAREQLAA